MKKTVFLILLLLSPTLTFAADIDPFTTDGCSVFPDGTIEHQSLWSECCIKHDIAYWQGGTYDDRTRADQGLELCVGKVGEPEIAKIMLAGVRAGGSPYFPTSYRWGYGWAYPRGYKALTENEKNQVREKLNSMTLLIKSILKELKP